MEIQSTGVVGAGTMGAGIAQAFALAGCDVHLTDLRRDALDAALESIEHGRFGLRRAVELGKLAPDGADAALGRIAISDGLPPEGVDLVVEAVYEDLAVKSEVLRSLDRHLAPETVIASNTSGFSVASLAAATDRPERVLVWHFASPVAVMPLAEIVIGPRTDREVVDAVVALARRSGKNPVVVNDQPLAWGFVTNRILACIAREADKIVAEGIARPEEVDQLLKDCFRWPAGPFEMLSSTSGNWEGDAQTPTAEMPLAHLALTSYLFPYVTAGHRADP